MSGRGADSHRISRSSLSYFYRRRRRKRDEDRATEAAGESSSLYPYIIVGQDN